MLQNDHVNSSVTILKDASSNARIPLYHDAGAKLTEFHKIAMEKTTSYNVCVLRLQKRATSLCQKSDLKRLYDIHLHPLNQSASCDSSKVISSESIVFISSGFSVLARPCLPTGRMQRGITLFPIRTVTASRFCPLTTRLYCPLHQE